MPSHTWPQNANLARRAVFSRAWFHKGWFQQCTNEAPFFTWLLQPEEQTQNVLDFPEFPFTLHTAYFVLLRTTILHLLHRQSFIHEDVSSWISHGECVCNRCGFGATTIVAHVSQCCPCVSCKDHVPATASVAVSVVLAQVAQYT